MKRQAEKPNKRLAEAIRCLERSLTFSKKAEEDPFYRAGIVKSFEVALEYAWKEFKRRARDEGLEVLSPREAIKIAGRMGWIESVEKWLGFLIDRNIAVHDYLGVPESDYLTTIQDFLAEVRKLVQIK